MDFEIPQEHRMIKDLVARFVSDELIPLEPALMKREAAGEGISLTAAERDKVDRRSQELGLWGLDAPEDIGGHDLPVSAMVGVNEEMGRTIVHYYLPPDTPNLLMLRRTATPEQKRKYLEP